MVKTENNTELFEALKDLGRKIIEEDDQQTISGTKFIVFFKDGTLFEYNTRNDEALR